MGNGYPSDNCWDRNGSTCDRRTQEMPKISRFFAKISGAFWQNLDGGLLGCEWVDPKEVVLDGTCRIGLSGVW
jgi:hypothetical protein